MSQRPLGVNKVLAVLLTRPAEIVMASPTDDELNCAFLSVVVLPEETKILPELNRLSLTTSTAEDPVKVILELSITLGEVADWQMLLVLIKLPDTLIEDPDNVTMLEKVETVTFAGGPDTEIALGLEEIELLDIETEDPAKVTLPLLLIELSNTLTADDPDKFTVLPLSLLVRKISTDGAESAMLPFPDCNSPPSIDIAAPDIVILPPRVITEDNEQHPETPQGSMRMLPPLISSLFALKVTGIEPLED